MPEAVRLVPSRVDGLDGVAEVAVRPDRLELLVDGDWVLFPFVAMGEWPVPVSFWRFLARRGLRSRRHPVGERDWFHPPSQRFFRFYTSPRLTVYLPDESRDIPLGETLFYRLQAVMRQGGHRTWDLG